MTTWWYSKSDYYLIQDLTVVVSVVVSLQWQVIVFDSSLHSSRHSQWTVQASSASHLSVSVSLSLNFQEITIKWSLLQWWLVTAVTMMTTCKSLPFIRDDHYCYSVVELKSSQRRRVRRREIIVTINDNFNSSDSASRFSIAFFFQFVKCWITVCSLDERWRRLLVILHREHFKE